jgi:hypothetical protein
MDWASQPPNLPPGRSERDEFFQTRLFEELSARDRLNRETEERSERFISAVRDDVCYDPAFVEFFTQSHQRIAELKAKIARVRSGEITSQDIEDTKVRVASVIGLLHDQPESLHRQINSLEQKTQILMTKTIPAAIATYERELVQNRAFLRKLQEVETAINA